MCVLGASIVVENRALFPAVQLYNGTLEDLLNGLSVRVQEEFY